MDCNTPAGATGRPGKAGDSRDEFPGTAYSSDVTNLLDRLTNNAIRFGVAVNISPNFGRSGINEFIFLDIVTIL